MAAAAVSRVGFGDAAEAARAAFERGVPIAFPTESSYGLGVDPRNRSAVEHLVRLKGRPESKALPVVCADLAAVERLGVDLGAPVVVWASSRWPAALTVVVPLAAPIAAGGGAASVAIRIPDHADLRGLLDGVGGYLTATSANPSGRPPYEEPDAVAAWLQGLGVEALVVGSEPAPGGLPSTLVEWADGGPRVIRHGRVPIA